MAVGVALEGEMGRCGQCARSARAVPQLGCASKGAGGMVGKGRLCLGVVCRLRPPGPSRYGHCGAMPVEELE